MKVRVFGCEKVFCDRAVCGAVLEAGVPFVLEGFGDFGGCEVFVSRGGAIGGGVSFLGNSEMAWFPFGDSEERLIGVREFSGEICHTAREYSFGCDISCGGCERFVCGDDFEFCDCVSSDSGCVFAFKFAFYVIFGVFANGEYVISSKIPCGKLAVFDGAVELSFSPPNSLGVELFGRFSAWEIYGGIIREREEFSIAYSGFREGRKGNFNAETYPVCFFERMLFARLLKADVQAGFLRGFLSSELMGAVHNISEYLGEFCGIIGDVDGVVLLYRERENCYKTRKFALEISGEDRLFVENIVEIFDFSLPYLKENADCVLYTW